MASADLESIIANYEEVCGSDPGADIREFAPDRADENYREIVTELIRVDLELCWTTKNRKTIEDYACLFPNVIADKQCLDQIAFEEYRLRTSSGEDVTPLDYATRYAINANFWPVLSTPNEPQKNADKTDASKILPELPELPISSSTFQTEPNLAGRLISGQLASMPTVENSLHRRLRFIGLTIFISLLYLSFLAWFNPNVAKVGLFLGSQWLHWLNAFCLIVCSVVCFILWSRRRIQLTKLRTLELILFGSVLLELSFGLANDLFIDLELERPFDEHEMFHYASSWSLPFFALIVAYGTLVPSSWKRCTIIVSVIAIMPITICTVAAVFLDEFSATFFQSFLMQMLLWMATGAAIAIYGVRRLEESMHQMIRSGKLGRYRLIRRIGIGGMGEIFEAEHTLLNRRCAIKVMHPKWSLHPHLKTRFEREVQVLAGIAHPNVVQIYDFGFTNESIFYYVMEFLEGKNLEQAVIENERLQPRKAIEILSQVADALAVIHRGGIIHRDIKPSNIFLADSGGKKTAKLLDFGLIKSVSSLEPDQQLTQDGAIIGTPAYMSAEQAAGQKVDHRTDIYCLGAVAYFALTGNHAFARTSAVETLMAHINSDPPPLGIGDDPISRELQDILFRCLAKDPKNRFQTAEELSEALHAIKT